MAGEYSLTQVTDANQPVPTIGNADWGGEDTCFLTIPKWLDAVTPADYLDILGGMRLNTFYCD